MSRHRDFPSPWFWRAWPLLPTYDPDDGSREHHRDFRLKSEARTFVATNGGGSMRKMRHRSANSTESRDDSIQVESAT